MTNTLLGKKTAYKDRYDTSLLCPISRQENRNDLKITKDLPFHGIDLWTMYELSWLNPKGKPFVAMAEFSFPCESPYLIESKSLKLYLNSLNQTNFDSMDHLKKTIEHDLSHAVGLPVNVNILSLNEDHTVLAKLPGELIDDLDITIDQYHVDPNLLKTVTSHPDTRPKVTEETLTSNLLRSLCPVTGQPDWASVMIHYRGPKIDRARLLHYIISFRQNQEFGEHCVERMFTDIQTHCACEDLSVYARYTRRGGLDINPFRSNMEQMPQTMRLSRQ